MERQGVRIEVSMSTHARHWVTKGAWVWEKIACRPYTLVLSHPNSTNLETMPRIRDRSLLRKDSGTRRWF